MASDEAPKRSVGGIARKFGAWLLATGAAVGTIAICAVSLHLLYARAAAADRPTPTPPLPVEVMKVEIQPSYAIVERFAGRIETAQETELAFERSGLVIEVAVEEGERARKGQAIARLDDRSLIADRDRLSAEKRRIETQLALANRTRKRQQDLSTKGFASEQRFDEAQANETALQAQIESIKAQLRQREIDIEKSRLLAPFDGLIAERFLDPGAVTSPGRAVARLLEVGAPRARIGLPPEQASSLKLGEAYAMTLRGRSIQGRLIALRPDLAPGTRTVAALFDLRDSVSLGATGKASVDGKLAAPAGEIVRLSLERRIEASGLWLPLASLQEGVKGLWSVYTVVKDQEASDQVGEPVWVVGQEAVQALRVQGQKAFVAGSIGDGAMLVISGVNRIARGQRVRPLAAQSDGAEKLSAAGGDLKIESARR